MDGHTPVVWRHADKRWQRMTPPGARGRLFGCTGGTVLHVAYPPAGQRSYRFKLSLYNRNNKPVVTLIPKRLRSPVIQSCSRDGVYVTDVRFYGSALYRTDRRGKLMLVQAGGSARGPSRGIANHRFMTDGARIWTRHPMMGDKSEHRDFIDFFPQQPGSLWYASAQGARRRLVSNRHVIRPRFVSQGRGVVYWSAGQRKGGVSTWRLMHVDVNTGKIKKLLDFTRTGYVSRAPGKLFADQQSHVVVVTSGQEVLAGKRSSTFVLIDTRTGRVSAPIAPPVERPAFFLDAVVWWSRPPNGADGTGSQVSGELWRWRGTVDGAQATLKRDVGVGRGALVRWLRGGANRVPPIGASSALLSLKLLKSTKSKTAAQRVGHAASRKATVEPAMFPRTQARAWSRRPGVAMTLRYDHTTRTLTRGSGIVLNPSRALVVSSKAGRPTRFISQPGTLLTGTSALLRDRVR
ncbi:MAG: hypothetical protein KC502_21595 [Myxococcales bacterium]|nr:hypothetical protein [Myxococcales bacterium]